MKNLAYSAVLAMLLSACATKSTAPDKKTTTRIGDAVTSPLSDLNLVRTKIPEVLNEARKNPYRKPADTSCESIATEVGSLDEALGPDLDATRSKGDRTLLEKGGSLAEDSAINALRGTTEGIIPFRGWVRKLTGAERHSKEVASAIASGIVRRAYLKGLGEARGCTAPAAPIAAPAQSVEQKPVASDQANP